MQAVLIFRLHQLNVRPPPQLLQILESQTLAMKYIGLEVTPNMSAHNPLARTNYVVRPSCNTPLYLKETTATEEKWHWTAAVCGRGGGVVPWGSRPWETQERDEAASRARQLCKPLHDDGTGQVGFLQGLALVSQLFVWEGGHEDKAGGSHGRPGVHDEESDVADPGGVGEWGGG